MYTSVKVWPMMHRRWPVLLYSNIKYHTKYQHSHLIYPYDYASLFDLPARLSAEAKGRLNNHRPSRSSSWVVFRDRSSESGSAIGLETAFLVSYQENEHELR